MKKPTDQTTWMLLLVAALISFPLMHERVRASGENRAAETVNAGQPENGQPAADVFGSEDVWGNPTFIGGLTNSGPQLNASSTW